MNTETGRIYDLEELYPDKSKRQKQLDADVDEQRRRLYELRSQLPTPEVAFSDPAIALSVKEQRDELARAFATDQAVPVSAQVAHTMKLGQREVQRRAKRRKAEKQARKKNR